MARGINKVILIGNLGQDPETRYMPSGDAVTNVRLATSETWKDRNTGEQQERTEWHSVVFFGKLGEIAGQYLRKGSKVYVEGSLRTRKWQGQDGNDRYTTEIRANEMQMLDSRSGGGYDAQQSAPEPARPQPAAAAPAAAPAAASAEAAQAAPAKAPVPSQAAALNEDFDDDIPF